MLRLTSALLVLSPALLRAVPVITFTAPAAVMEGAPDYATAQPSGNVIELQLTLSEPAPAGCEFRFTPRAGSTAIPGVDYEIPATGHTQITVASGGRYVLDTGVQSAVLRLRTLGDWLGEPDKVLAGSLTHALNCTLPSPNWNTVIEDEDRVIFAVAKPTVFFGISVTLFDDRFHVIHSFTSPGQYGAGIVTTPASLALADVYGGDGVPEVIIGTGRGVVSRFDVFKWYGPQTGVQREYFPFGTLHTLGCVVGAGDCGGPGRREEVAVSPGPGEPVVIHIYKPHAVQPVLEYASQRVIRPGLQGAPTGGAATAMGDGDGDGVGDYFAAYGQDAAVTGMVELFRGSYGAGHEFDTGTSIFEPYPGNRDGISLGAGDWNGDGFAEIVTGAGPASGSHVRVYDRRNNAVPLEFFVTGPEAAYLGGAWVTLSPRPHYSPSGGWRSIVLATARSQAHPGIMRFSDGAAPVTPPGDLLVSPAALAAWTPRQLRSEPMALQLTSFTREVLTARARFFVSHAPAGGLLQLEQSPSMSANSWLPQAGTPIIETGPDGTGVFEVSGLSGLGLKHFWRLRRQ